MLIMSAGLQAYYHTPSLSSIDDLEGEYGFPVMVELSRPWGGDALQVRVRWFRVVLLVGALYVVCMPLGRKTSRWLFAERHWRHVVLAVIATAVLAACVAGLTCRLTWGYWFIPRDIDPRLLGAKGVIGWGTFLVPEQTPDKPSTWGIAWGANDLSPDQTSADSAVRAGGVMRWISRLRDNSIPISNVDSPISRDFLAEVLACVEELDIYDLGSSGYEASARYKMGNVVLVQAHNGETLVYLSFGSGKVSKYRSAKYEILFQSDNGSQRPLLLSAYRLYESTRVVLGKDWPSLFGVYFCALLILICIGSLCFVMMRSLLRSIRGQP